MKNATPPELPCPACGGCSFSWGQLHAQGVNFIPDGLSFWRKMFRAGWKLPARRCDDCGNIQLFSKPQWSLTAEQGRTVGSRRRDSYTDFE